MKPEEAAEKEARAAEEAKMLAELQARRRKRQRTQASARQVVEQVPAFNPNASTSVRVGLDPRLTYRLVARDHSIDVVAVNDDGVPLAHFLGNVPHLGPLRAMFTMRRPEANHSRTIFATPITDFDESQPTGALDLTESNDPVVE